MEHLLRFKTGIDSLNGREMKKVINSLSRQYLTFILFNHFHSKIINAESFGHLNNMIVPEIQAFNNKISKQIQARKSKPKQGDDIDDDLEQEMEPIHFDEIPPVIISNISSFMQFKDLLNLEKCSKVIFLGTRSPISLKELPSKYTTKLIEYLNDDPIHCKYSHFYRFRTIKKFNLDIYDYLDLDGKYKYEYKYNLNDIPFWNQLKVLKVTNSLDFVCKESNIFMHGLLADLASLDLSTLETIKIEPFIPKTTAKILSHAPSLEFVHFDRDRENEGYLLPSQIRGISIYDKRTYLNIPPNAQSLHLKDYESLFNKNLKYNNLEELCMEHPEQKEIDYFNKQNLNNLQRIHWSEYRNKWSEELDIKSVELLFSPSNIKYISIKIRSKMGRMINILNNALKGTFKQCIKIRLVSTYQSAMNVDKTQKQILELIKTLKTLTLDFMLIAKFRMKANEKIPFVSSEEHCLSIQSKVENENDQYKEFKVVISNKECKLRGYQEKWLMECSRCKQHYQ